MKYTKDQIIKELVALLPTGHFENTDDSYYSCPKHPSYRCDRGPDKDEDCNCGFDQAEKTLERLGIKR